MKTFLFLIILWVLLSACSQGNKGTQKSEAHLLKMAVVVSNNGLMLRKHPTSKSDQIALLPQNTQVRVLEHSQVWENLHGINGEWLKVKFNNVEGYAFSRRMQLNGSSAPGLQTSTQTSANQPKVTYLVRTNSGNGLFVRKSPYKGAQKTVLMPDNSYVTMLEYGQEWSRISYNGQVGWTYTQYLIEASKAGQGLKYERATIRTYGGTGSVLKKSAYYYSQKIIDLPEGARVAVIRKEKDWYFVEYGSYKGWVHSFHTHKD